MRCLTNQEVTEWLRKHSIPEDPYSGVSSPRYYLQFYPPLAHGFIDAFVRTYHLLMMPDSEAMVHMTDWSTYEPSEMLAIMGIRSMSEENRWLIHAPGHLLTPEESETSVALFSLSASFAWSSYLYCPKYNSTLFNWEGEIFDFWTDCVVMMAQMKRLLELFQLKETEGQDVP